MADRDPMSAAGLREIARTIAPGSHTNSLPRLAGAILDCEDLTREDLAMLLLDFARAVQAELRYSAATDGGRLVGAHEILGKCEPWSLEIASGITNQVHANGLTVYPLPAPLSLRLTGEIARALEQERARPSGAPPEEGPLPALGLGDMSDDMLWLADFEPFHVDGIDYSNDLAMVLIMDGQIRAHVETGSGSYDRAHVFDVDRREVYSAELSAEDFDADGIPYDPDDPHLTAARVWCEARLREAGQ